MRCAFGVEAEHFLNMLALLTRRAFAAARIDRQLAPTLATGERDREVGVEKELLQVLRSDCGDVLEHLKLASLSLQDDAVRFRIGMGEAYAPLITATEERLALLVDLRSFRRSRVGASERRRCGYGDEVGRVVECEHDKGSHRRLAGHDRRCVRRKGRD